MTSSTYMKIDVTNIPTKTLVEVYNACQEKLGGRPVSKFEDRSVAEKRTRFVLSQIRPEKRPEPFREGNPIPAKEEVPVPSPIITFQTEEDDGEKDMTETTLAPVEDAKATDVASGGDLDFGNRVTKRRKALVDSLVANRNKFVALGDLVKAVYGADADVKEMKGALMMSMKGIYRLIEDNELPVELKKRKEGKDISYCLVDKA